MKQYKWIVTPSFIVYNLELAEALSVGWEFDEERMPVAGFQYECHLVREVDENETPKLTRSEIMAIARKARAEKARQKAEQENV
jgi:hypothetical protein